MEPKLEATLTLADGSTSSLVVYADYSEQWGADTPRLEQTGPFTEALQGLFAEHFPREKEEDG